jgi:hypothetical protein
MKTQILVLSITAAVITSSFTTNPIKPAPQKQTLQSNGPFDFFRVHRQGKNAVATWGYSDADGVSCFNVERTYQDPTDPYSYWEPVVTMPCNNSRSYKHTDVGIYAGTIYYRVKAHMNNGDDVVSEVADLRIVAH